jgi:hypothetical protein
MEDCKGGQKNAKVGKVPTLTMTFYKGMGARLKMVVIRNVLHDIFHTAAEDIAEFIDGIDFRILLMTKPAVLPA